MNRHTDPTPRPDALRSAREAGLRYLADDGPGITRRRRGKGFAYYDPQGQHIRDEQVLDRIKALAIPPAWTEVWISPTPHGHLQATGRDDRGRKQYRYHDKWRTVRDERKYHRLLPFGLALPRIRENVERILARQGLRREHVLAAAIRLLDTTGMRVGNDAYAKENHSHGLTTLRRRHVAVDGNHITFAYVGKGGKKAKVELVSPRLARIVQQCQEIPGQELFHYLDEEGQPHPIESQDVNEFLRELAGEAFTAKDFRTWKGTVEALVALAHTELPASKTDGKRKVAEAVKQVAQRLGNTPAVCRKYYIHPRVVDAYLDQALESVTFKHRDDHRPIRKGLGPAEEAVLTLLDGE